LGLPVSDIHLGEVGIRNGTIVYANAKTGAYHKLFRVNLTVSLPSLDSPFSSKGEVTWNGKKVVLETGAGSLLSIMEGKKTNVSVKIASDHLNVNFQGTTDLKPSMTVAGRWAVKVPSVRNLASWVGAPLNMKGEGFGIFEINGNITARPDMLSLQDVDIQFDKIKGKARTTVRLGDPRPSIKGTLQLETLNLNPYLPEKKPEAAGSPKKPAPSPSKPGPSGSKAGPSKSKPAGPAWSDEPIDFSGLQLVDADLSFRAKEIIYEKIKIGQSAVSLKLKGGRLALDLSRLELYKGSGQLKVSLDSVSNPPSLTKQMKLSGVEALPLLTDAAEIKLLSGKANAEFSLKTRGKSQLQLVKSLNGNAKVQFQDGAIEGVNLGAMFRNIKSAFLNPKATETRKTDFSELSATFQIRNGLMRTNDLFMKSPLLRLTGKGVISLPPKTMDMRLEPKIVRTSKGQGGAADTEGIKVPVVVNGPWDNLSYTPDIGGIVESVTKDPDAVKGVVEGVIKGDKDSKKKLKETLKGIFR
jgi:AsmA protein